MQPKSTAKLGRIRIEPAHGWGSFSITELWAYRDLLFILALRDIRLRYKQTVFGIAWVILQPLVASLIFAAIFGLFANLPSDGVPYILFVFAGLLPWNLFAGALQRAGTSLVSDARLISKIYFPRIAVPISSTIAVVIDFAVALCVMFALMLILGFPVTLNLLALPLFLLLALIISISISLLISALNVYYRDFMYALPFVIQVWMYLSPVVYSSDLIPGWLRPVYALNPMVGVIDGFRWSLLGYETFPVVSVAISLATMLILFLVGLFVFQRIEHSFADVI